VIGPIELMLAFVLDLLIGDPAWLPHPVRIIGRGITHMETFLRAFFTARGEKAAGIFLVVLIIIPSAFLAFLLQKSLLQASQGIFMIISKAVLVYLISTTIALRELVASAGRVINAIKAGMLEDARVKLSMIVGRDTADLSDEGVLRATIETLAENLSDGVIAPLFYLAIGGLPLAIAYKAINTLDSMVGYKNDRYIRFGWAAAKIDDLANYIPARISGILIAFASCIVSYSLFAFRLSLKTMVHDGRNHTSPNSGMPEAAMAGALGVRLGGPSTYGGLLVDKPYIGEAGTVTYLAASENAVTIVVAASVLAVISAIALLVLRDLS